MDRLLDPRMEGIAQNNIKELKFIAKDMGDILKLINPTEIKEGKMDEFEGNVVMSSFYLNAYHLGTLAFNRMIDDRQKGIHQDWTIVDYFAVVAAAEMEKFRDFNRKMQEGK